MIGDLIELPSASEGVSEGDAGPILPFILPAATDVAAQALLTHKDADLKRVEMPQDEAGGPSKCGSRAESLTELPVVAESSVMLTSDMPTLASGVIATPNGPPNR